MTKNSRGRNLVVLENASIALTLDRDMSGAVQSIVHVPSGRDFVHPGTRPLYRLALSGDSGEGVDLTSENSNRFEVDVSSDEGTQIATLRFLGHGDLEIDVTCTVRLEDGSNLTRWRIAVANNTGLGVRTIAFPVVVVPPVLGDTDEDDYYVSGRGFGLIANKPGRILDKVEPPRGEVDPERPVLKTDFAGGCYPGPTTAQMQAFYDPEAGLYMATYDDGGHVKHFRYAPAQGEQALDLTIQHHYDERPGLDFELPYDTVVGTFKGDWYDAADLYKEWAHRQHWCSRKLGDRDVPSWFTEPRPHLMFISRGGVDRAQATLPCPPSEFPLGKFWPARKLVPLVERYAEAFESPGIVWLEGWEKIGSPGGPVDIFPPYEGEESFKAAIEAFARNGHITSLYLAALHWCYRRASTGYYGEERFEKEGRPLAALNERGDVDRFAFPSAQKHFVNLCVGCEEVVSLYLENFMKLMELGATWIQLDQQVGLYSPVCYSEKHGHPRGFGPWMYERMLEFVRGVRGAARERNPEAAFTCENACEIWIQEIDAFMNRPYLSGDELHALPIFEYLYHEFALTYGGDMAMWLAHVDASCIKHAMCCVHGLQNLVSIGEPDYDLDVEEVEHPVIPLLANIVKAQRTYARDYLVFGSMLRPTRLDVRTVPIELWWPPTAREITFIVKDVPAVVHAVWESQDGRVGHVLVNWTGEKEPIELEVVDPKKRTHVVTGEGRTPVPEEQSASGGVRTTVPPRSVMLVEQEAG